MRPKGRYLGLRGGQVLAFGPDAVGLLVKSATADAQLEAERPKPSPKSAGVGTETPGGTHPTGGAIPVTPTPGGGPTPTAAPPTLFFGSVKVDAARISRDVGTIANEIIQHLASLPNSEIYSDGGNPSEGSRRSSRQCGANRFGELPDAEVQEPELRAGVIGHSLW